MLVKEIARLGLEIFYYN